MQDIIMTFVGLAALTVLFWIGYKLTGTLLKMLIWVCFCLPVGLALILFGILLCCTILLIPIGKRLCRAGLKLMFH